MEPYERTLTFPSRAPCFVGHFPGNPIVPAVAILAELIAWAEGELGYNVTRVVSARFRKPLLPDVCWQILLEDRGTGEITVTGSDGGCIAMKARLTVEIF